MPTQDAADFQTYVDVQDHYLALLRRLTLTLRDGDVTEIVRVAEALQRARGERLDAATDLGSTNCGK